MHPPRLSDFDYEGFFRYFLTFCTAHRAPHFISAMMVRPVVAHIRQCAALERFAVSAYCVMPDHVHLVMHARDATAQLRRCATRMKQQTGYWFAQAAGSELWQKGYYDHILREEEDEFGFVLYVLSDPVRSGMTDALGEYPFAGSDEYSLDDLARGMRERGWNSYPTRQVLRVTKLRQG